MLPDVALLEIFDFYVNEAEWIRTWHTLVHVCQRWRDVVFGSSRRLGLRLVCTGGTPVREALAIWPPLPIVILREGWHPTFDMDNIFAALVHTDRVCEIGLCPVPEKVLAKLQEPLPALTDLKLHSKDETAPAIPDSFLGGSAPRLKYLSLNRIPFPGLPILLSSATGLVKISLLNIPQSGNISPEAFATCLSSLTSLTELILAFLSPRPRPVRESRHPPTITRSVLPTLRHFRFAGVSEYLDDLVALIDTPLLDSLQITFFHQLIFDTPQLAQFISRTPRLKAQKDAHVVFSYSGVTVLVPGIRDKGVQLKVSCSQMDWQLSSLAQVCRSSFPQAIISSLERLAIYDDICYQPCWQDDIENDQWLEILHPFTAVKDLRLSRGFAPRIAPALQELARERVTKVLPALQCLNLEELNPSESFQKAIMQFVTARQLCHVSLAGGKMTFQLPSRTCPLYFLLHLRFGSSGSWDFYRSTFSTSP